MVDIVVKVLDPADNEALVSLAEAKVFLGISPADVSNDAQLQMLINMNSATIAEMCNRTFGRAKLRETWRCVGPVCCPNGMCRVYLTHWPVLEADIENVETPAGVLLDPSEYEVEEQSGKLLLFNGCSSEIVITYTGGFVLPDESPDALKQALGLLVRTGRTEAAAEATSGIRMIAHKDSRVMYHPPSKTSGSSSSTSGGSLATAQIKNLLIGYTRIFV
jgi:hypothetical protein